MTSRVYSGTDVSPLLADIDRDVEAGFRATLALAFCSADQDASALGGALSDRGLRVVGATTAGEIAGPDVLGGAAVVMLWDAAPEGFLVWSGARAEAEATEALTGRLGRAAAEQFARPVVIAFVSGLGTDGEAVVRGVREGAGRDLPLYGGLAGDDLRVEETLVFSGAGALPDGVVALVLDGDRYHVEGVATSGWQAVGVEKTVTRSEANAVYALDGEHVLDVYRRYFDLGDLRGADVDIMAEVGSHFPLSVERGGGAAVMRAPLFSDLDREALVFGGTVEEGARVRFCIPPSLDVADRVIAEARALQERLPVADAVLLVSCTARRLALGPTAEDEVAGIHDVWGAPTAGFFSYGEIAPPAGAACDFHNVTCALVAVRERAAS